MKRHAADDSFCSVLKVAHPPVITFSAYYIGFLVELPLWPTVNTAILLHPTKGVPSSPKLLTEPIRPEVFASDIS
jgi:hypothetical protein